jgi:predicted transcriptional regulator
MSIATIKLDLAKKIMDTNDEELIGYIKSIFDGQSENWFEELPIDVQASIERGLAQSEKGEVKPHEEVMKKYKK